MKPFTKIAAILFGILSIVHLIRLFNPFQVVIGNFEVPFMASIGFLIVALVMCIGLWKESK